MLTGQDIIRQIITSGGWHANAALQVLSEEKEDQFIAECFDQCHNKSVVDAWGADLVLEIIHYRLELIRSQLRIILRSF